MLSRFQQFASSISAVSHYVQKIQRAEMANLGMKGPHAQYLVALTAYPQGLTAAQLRRICDKDKAAVSRAVADLEAAGMVMRTGTRAYRAPLVLTEQGRQAAAAVNERVGRAVERAGRGLSDENRKVFYEALELISGNLQRIAMEGIDVPEE